MSNAEDDLNATRDDLHADAKRLAQIEAEKKTVDLKDKRIVELSLEAEDITRRMVPKAAAETALSKEIANKP